MKKTILVDAKNLLYRAHFAFQGLQTTQGMPTSVLHGFATMILDVLQVVPNANVVIVWEGDMLYLNGKRVPSRPLWRKDLAPYYKANRKPNAKMEDATSQLPQLFKLLGLIGWPQLCIQQLEADDIIGVLANYLPKYGNSRAYIYSSDQDFYQLIGKSIHQLKPTKEGASLFLKEDVLESSGVLPTDYVRYKALAGDTSDNIKPLPGVGPKTALKLLADGVDASQPDWLNLPKSVRAKHPKLQKNWARIYEAYVLSYIPRRARYPYLPDTCMVELQKACDQIAGHHTNSQNSSRIKHRMSEFRHLCLEHELSSLAALAPHLIKE